eukprot:7386910-Prymnesium_polylepis.3
MCREERAPADAMGGREARDASCAAMRLTEDLAKLGHLPRGRDEHDRRQRVRRLRPRLRGHPHGEAAARRAANQHDALAEEATEREGGGGVGAERAAVGLIAHRIATSLDVVQPVAGQPVAQQVGAELSRHVGVDGINLEDDAHFGPLTLLAGCPAHFRARTLLQRRLGSVAVGHEGLDAAHIQRRAERLREGRVDRAHLATATHEREEEDQHPRGQQRHRDGGGVWRHQT